MAYLSRIALKRDLSDCDVDSTRGTLSRLSAKRRHASVHAHPALARPLKKCQRERSVSRSVLERKRKRERERLLRLLTIAARNSFIERDQASRRWRSAIPARARSSFPREYRGEHRSKLNQFVSIIGLPSSSPHDGLDLSAMLFIAFLSQGSQGGYWLMLS